MVSRFLPECGGVCDLIQGCHHYQCRYSPPYINFALLRFHVYCCTLILKCKTSNGEIVCLKQKEKSGIYKQLWWVVLKVQRNCVLFSDKGAQTSIDGNEHYNLSCVVLRQHLGMLLTEKNPTRCNSVSKFLLFLILNEAQHVSGDTPPIFRSCTTSNNCTSDNLPHMQTQRLLVQF